MEQTLGMVNERTSQKPNENSSRYFPDLLGFQLGEAISFLVEISGWRLLMVLHSLSVANINKCYIKHFPNKQSLTLFKNG